MSNKMSLIKNKKYTTTATGTACNSFEGLLKNETTFEPLLKEETTFSSSYVPDDYPSPWVVEENWPGSNWLKVLPRDNPAEDIDQILKELKDLENRIIRFKKSGIENTISTAIDYTQNNIKMPAALTAEEARTLSNTPNKILSNLYSEIRQTAENGGTMISWYVRSLSDPCVQEILKILQKDNYKCTADPFDPFTILIRW